MGCAVSCMQQTTMSLFGKKSNSSVSDLQAKIERRLYLAKETPEPDFDLSDCELKRVPSGIYLYCKVYRKEILDLKCNKLKSLDGGGLLSDLYLIKVLNISSNRFSQLPSEIRYLANLTELYVQENFMEYIPDSIEELQNLQIFNVSHNRLKALTASLGKLQQLRKLIITENHELTELCPELCLARNLISIELDYENFSYPPSEIISQGTIEVMKYLCKKLNVEYIAPNDLEIEVSTVHSPAVVVDPFTKRNNITWEEQEAAIIEQEKRYHQAAKQQRGRFLSQILEEQQALDCEIAKIHESKELERQKLIQSIQEEEQDIERLVKKFTQTENLKPEVLQQQLAHEQAEHDRLLEIVRQNYDNIKKSEVLKAMEILIEEDYAIQHSKKRYENTWGDVKRSMLMQELEGNDKLEELLQFKDQSRTVLVEQLLEDQDVQKALVGSLMEKTDARSWSLNEEISLISSQLARLSAIEQEKKKLQISFNYNEVLHQRVQMVNLLDDLLAQQTKRREQLVKTLREMEDENEVMATDFWLKNYQKLVDSAPRSLLDVGKHLDPMFANQLLQYGVIHCLPFLVKFLFSEGTLLDITYDNLKECGISLSADREGIIKAINSYVEEKVPNCNYDAPDSAEPSAPSEQISDNQNITGVITAGETEGARYESECVICMDSSCEAVFVPCGHMCCCLPCSRNEMTGCPLCRSDIERIIQVRVA